MKKVWLSFLLSLPLWAAPPDASFQFKFSNRTVDQADNQVTFTITAGVTQTLAINNISLGCAGWIFNYDSEGLSAESIVFQSAPAAFNGRTVVAGTWATFAGTTVSGSNPSTATTSSTYSATGYYPFVRIALTSSTGTGSININISCWKSTTFLNAGIAGTGTQGPQGNPGTNGTNGAISIIKDEGTSLPVRANLNFVGAGVTCSDNSPNTDCSIPGGGVSPVGSAGNLQYFVDSTHLGGSPLMSGAVLSLANFDLDFLYGFNFESVRDTFLLPQHGFFGQTDITAYDYRTGQSAFAFTEFDTAFVNTAAPAMMRTQEAHSWGTFAELLDTGSFAAGYYWYLEDDIDNNNFDFVIYPTKFIWKSDMRSCWSSAVGSFPMPVEDTCFTRVSAGVASLETATPGTYAQLNLGNIQQLANVVNPVVLSKNTQTATAPGAGKADMRWIAGTNMGTCKLVSNAGTSATEVTIVDNVGGGC